MWKHLQFPLPVVYGRRLNCTSAPRKTWTFWVPILLGKTEMPPQTVFTNVYAFLSHHQLLLGWCLPLVGTGTNRNRTVTRWDGKHESNLFLHTSLHSASAHLVLEVEKPLIRDSLKVCKLYLPARVRKRANFKSYQRVHRGSAAAARWVRGSRDPRFVEFSSLRWVSRKVSWFIVWSSATWQFTLLVAGGLDAEGELRRYLLTEERGALAVQFVRLCLLVRRKQYRKQSAN